MKRGPRSLAPDRTAADLITGCFAHPAFHDAVLCTHGEVMQPLLQLESIRAATRRRRITRQALLTKGSAWRLHIDDDGHVIKLTHLTPR